MKRCFIYAAGTFYGLREPPRGAIFRSPQTRDCICASALASDRTLC